MFCPNCGKDVGDNRFCPECGTKINITDVINEVKGENGSDMTDSQSVENTAENVDNSNQKRNFKQKVADKVDKFKKLSTAKKIVSIVALVLALLILKGCGEIIGVVIDSATTPAPSTKVYVYVYPYDSSKKATIKLTKGINSSYDFIYKGTSIRDDESQIEVSGTLYDAGYTQNGHKYYNPSGGDSYLCRYKWYFSEDMSVLYVPTTYLTYKFELQN